MHPDVLTWNVIGAAVGVAVVHTALGPDHSLPFVALARARHWSRTRTLTVAAACGAAHVAASLALGLFGVLAGVAVGALDGLESGRGGIAAWALVAVGAAYSLWGVRRGCRARRGIALHRHDRHGRDASHGHGHLHVHAGAGAAHEHPQPGGERTSWALFLVFVLGPCEPLIPLFVLPASQGRWALAGAAAAAFAVATITTMLGIVALALAGAERLPLGPLERWSHALAGVVIAGSGLAVALGGL